MSWTATLVDGSKVQQYNNNVETRYGDLDMSAVECFTVTDFGNTVSVFPLTGVYHINEQQFEYENFSEDDELKIVYFRRNRVTLGKDIQHTYSQFIGLRNFGNDKKKSKQLLIEISEEGIKIHYLR